MTRVSVVDRLEIADKRTTSAGYLAVRAKIARDGVYQYARGEVGLPGNPNEMVGVYRSHDFVFDDAHLATFANKPVCIGHPKDAVTAKNWKKLAVGQIGNKVWEAEDRKHVEVDLILMDQAGIDAAQSSHRELSCGYSCSIVADSGVSPEGEKYEAVMTGPLVADHLALVPQGRAGSQARIGDAAWPTEDFLPPSNSTPRKRKNPMLVDGLKIDLSDEEAVASLVKKLTDTADAAAAAKATAETALADAQAATATAATQHATAIQAKDAELETLKAEKATLETQLADASSPEKLKAAAAAYAKVVDTAKALGATVADGASETEIKRSVVQAKLGDAAANWTDAQFDVSFNTLAAGVKVEATDALRQSHQNPTALASLADARSGALTAHAEMVERLKNPASAEAK